MAPSVCMMCGLAHGPHSYALSQTQMLNLRGCSSKGRLPAEQVQPEEACQIPQIYINTSYVALLAEHVPHGHRCRVTGEHQMGAWTGLPAEQV